MFKVRYSNHNLSTNTEFKSYYSDRLAAERKQANILRSNRKDKVASIISQDIVELYSSRCVGCNKSIGYLSNANNIDKETRYNRFILALAKGQINTVDDSRYWSGRGIIPHWRCMECHERFIREKTFKNLLR